MRTKILSVALLAALALGTISAASPVGDADKQIVCDSIVAEKPVIYLYDESNEAEKKLFDEEHAREVRLTLSKGEIGTTYPAIDPYDNSWTVTAYPDGTLIGMDGREYGYLFWDADMPSTEYLDVSKGFSVKGSETAEFLEKKLAEWGLNARETQDFITHWLPRMEKNPWNTFCFQSTTYTDWAKLSVSPKTDATIRVFVVWYPTDTEEKIDPQKAPSVKRGKCTLVEWGGAEVRVEYVKKHAGSSTTTTTTTTTTTEDTTVQRPQ